MTITFRRTVLSSVALLAIGGCSAPVLSEAGVARIPPAETRISGMDNPTSPADLQQATSVLDVNRYRPSYRLEGCPNRPLPAARPDAALATSLLSAKAYSDAQKGLGLIVLRDGAVVHESYAEGVDGTTPNASASMMKSVIALLYGIAINQGVIGGIDEPVGTYLADWRDDMRGAITLRQLLTMSAGLGQSDFMKILLAPDIAQAAMAIQRTAQPDTEFAYNNAITKVLTEVLDRRLAETGKGDVLTFLENELWCPLGNGTAQVWIDQQGRARGYAGLHAGLTDWVRIGELIRNKGKVDDRQIVPESWIEEMTSPSIANAQYGLHVWLGREFTPQRAYNAVNPIKVPHAEPFADPGIVFFDGFGGQRVYVIASRGLTIARIGEVNLAYDDAIIPNLLIRAANETE